MKCVHGYKVFHSDWTCGKFSYRKQYYCPGKFEEDVMLKLCHSGMHFCENLGDCFKYYAFNPENKVAEVFAYGRVLSDGVKSVTDKLEIVREIPWDEVLRLVNIGKDCTGLCNTGNWNTGNWNTGDRNTGYWNTGDRNTGDWNTGDWNKSSFNTGCFMTEEQNIMMFNKPSDWTYQMWWDSKARFLLSHIPRSVAKWVESDDMTDEERKAHPEYKTTLGYLKVLDEPDSAQIWWNGLSDGNKEIIKSLPNFDPDIFYQCTGIKVDE